MDGGYMKKTILFGSIVALLLLVSFGCLGIGSQPPPTKEGLAFDLNNTAKVTAPPEILVSGNSSVSVAKVMALQNGTKGWRFPLKDYPKPFEVAGLYSDSFVVLNSSHIKMLGPNETIWLTPMIRSGDKAVLFNAIYSKDIDTTACRKDIDDTITTMGQKEPPQNTSILILGKQYALGDPFLVNGSSFGLDDKWRVQILIEPIRPAKVSEEQYWISSYMYKCPRQIIIYMDGYFSDIKDGEQIPLFRNDNTILFKFDRERTGTGNSMPGAGNRMPNARTPYFEVIGTKPLIENQFIPNQVLADYDVLSTHANHALLEICRKGSERLYVVSADAESDGPTTYYDAQGNELAKMGFVSDPDEQIKKLPADWRTYSCTVANESRRSMNLTAQNDSIRDFEVIGTKPVGG